MIVYHHNDMDGKSAGYLVHRMKPKAISDSPYSYVMMTYDDDFNKHNEKDDVFIVDLSISENTYPKLLEICKTARTVTWIDHHESSVAVVAKHKDELQSIKNLTYFISKAACGAALTYAFFKIPQDELKKIRVTEDSEEYEISATYAHSNNSGTIKVTTTKVNKNSKTDAVWFEYNIELPRWLFYVDDFDCWKQINRDTEYFKFGIETEDSVLVKYNKKTDTKYFNTEFWGQFDNDDDICDDYIHNGHIISDYEHSENYRNLRHTFLWEYEGTQFICLNTTKKSSMSFEHLMKKYPAAIAFSYSGAAGRWVYSVYADAETSKFNCQKFAEKFGGGGHVGAAGFSTEKLIFTSTDFAENNKAEPIIFLGGTCNNDPWREEFIQNWKKKVKNEDSLKHIELFNPVVDDWNEEAQRKEEETKKKAFINLFVITPKMVGVFSIAEAVECAHKKHCKTVFVMYDKFNAGYSTDGSGRVEKSLDATGKLIEDNGGVYIKVNGQDASVQLVEAIAKLANK